MPAETKTPPRIMYFYITIATLSALLLTNSICQATAQCELLINTKCTGCHYKTRICEKLGKKSKSAWRSTIKRMVKHGVEIDGKEIKILTDCLYNMQPGDKVGCEDIEPAPVETTP